MGAFAPVVVSGIPDMGDQGILLKADGGQSWAFYPYSGTLNDNNWSVVNAGTGFFDVTPGSAIYRKIIVQSQLDYDASVNLSVSGIPGSWPVTMGAGDVLLKVISPLNYSNIIISVPADATPGIYPYTILASTYNSTLGQYYNSTLSDSINVVNDSNVSGTLSDDGDLQPEAVMANISGIDAVIEFSPAIYSFKQTDGDAVLNVTRSGNLSVITKTTYHTIDGDALAGIEYMNTTGSLTFLPGETSKNIIVPLLYNSLDSLTTKKFYVTLDSQDNGVPDNNTTAIVSVSDDPLNILFTFNDTPEWQLDNNTFYPNPQNPGTLTWHPNSDGGAYAGTWSDQGNANLPESVSILISPQLNLTKFFYEGHVTSLNVTTGGSCNYATYGGMQIRLWTGSNYSNSVGSSSLCYRQGTFKGISTSPIDYDLITDHTIATFEDFTWTPSKGAVLDWVLFNATVAPAPKGVFGFYGDHDVSENIGTYQLPVYRRGGTAGSVSVDYRVTGGTARNGVDYLLQNGTLNFPDGASVAYINVPITNDNIYTGNRTFTLGLSNPTNGSALQSEFGMAATTVTIRDDDQRALHHPAEKLYIGGEGNIAVLNADTLQPITSIPIDGTAFGVGVMDPTGSRMYFATDAGEFIAIDTLDDTVAGVVTGLTGGWGCVLSPDGKTAYVGSHDQGTLSVIDTTTMTEMYEIPVSPNYVGIQAGRIVNNTIYYIGARNYGAINLTTNSSAYEHFEHVWHGGFFENNNSALLAMGSDTENPGTHGLYRWYMANDTLVPLNVNISIDDIKYSPTTGLLYAPNGDYDNGDNIYVISPENYTILGNITAANHQYWIEIDDAGQLYDLRRDDAQILVVNTAYGGVTDVLDTMDYEDYYFGAFGIGMTGLGVPGFGEPAYAADQSDGHLHVDVLRQGGSNGTITVDYTTVNGTAMAGQDYMGTSGTLTFPEGVTEQSIDVQLLHSSSFENRTFYIQLFNSSTLPGTINNASATITKTAMPVIEFSPASYTYNESDGAARLQVVRTGDAQVPLSVGYYTTDGQALAGSEYTNTTGTLTFMPGDTMKTITVPFLQDNRDSLAPRNFYVTLTSPVGATLGNNTTATVSLRDDDAFKVLFTFNDTNNGFTRTLFPGGNGQDSWVWHPNSYGGPYAGAWSNNGSARSGERSGIVSMPINVTRWMGLASVKSVNLTFGYRLVGSPNGYNARVYVYPGAFSSTSTNRYTAASFNGGDGQYHTYTTTIPLSYITPNTTIVFASSIYSASAGWTIDYVMLNASVSQNPNGDIQFPASDYSTTEGAGVYSIPVQRLSGTSGTVTVNYNVTGGSAKKGYNYLLGNGTLTFADGVSLQYINATILDPDSMNLGDTTVKLTLSGPTGGAAIGTRNVATLTIADNDPLFPDHFTIKWLESWLRALIQFWGNDQGR